MKQKSISLVVDIDNVPEDLDPKGIGIAFNDGDAGQIGEALREAILGVLNCEEKELDDMQMDIRPLGEFEY